MRAPTGKESERKKRGRKWYGRRTWHNLQIKLRQDVIQHTCPTWRREKTRHEQKQWTERESLKRRVCYGKVTLLVARNYLKAES